MGIYKTVDIHYDMPSADTAIRRVTYNLRNAKPLGVSAIKFIHGYGSSGKGGKLRSEVRRYLERERASGSVRYVIAGDDFTIFDEPTRKAFALCPELRKDEDLERHNNGITIVVI